MLLSIVSSKENLKEDLKDMLEFDNDASGENGDEFTWDIALEKGFKTTIDYLVVTYTDLHGNTENAIKEILKAFLSGDSYYHEYDYSVITIEGKFFVSLAYTTQD